MTFVLAKKFGADVFVVSDTQISHPSGGIRPDSSPRAADVVPGRLKILPITPWLSIAYAGLSVAALDLIRSASKQRHDLNAVLDILILGSAQYDCDFIVVSHTGAPTISKISEGNLSGDQESHWIGDPSVAAELVSEFERTRNLFKRANDALPAAYRSDQSYLDFAWHRLMLGNFSNSSSVGGIPIALDAFRSGHRFLTTGGAYNPTEIRIVGDQVIGPDGPISGTYDQYSFAIVPSEHAGVAVLGVWLAEAHIGYIYEPLVRDDPEKWTQGDLTEFAQIVASRASTAHDSMQ